MSLHKEIADNLKGFGGILRCTVCLREEPIGDLAQNLRSGWPKCCDYTMRWVTQRELEAEGSPRD